MPASSRSRARSTRSPVGPLDTDGAFIALLIGAMEASGHTSPAEAARAHHIIWSTRRFRRRDGNDVGRRIERVKSAIERHGAAAVIEAGARTIPPRLRASAFALAADVVLVDGTLQRGERRFLATLASALRLRPEMAERVLDVIRIKNSA